MATNGDRFAIACRPSRHNQPNLVSLVKVLSEGSTNGGGSQTAPEAGERGHRFAIASLKDLGFTS
jgi:hypothetical protein